MSSLKDIIARVGRLEAHVANLAQVQHSWQESDTGLKVRALTVTESFDLVAEKMVTEANLKDNAVTTGKLATDLDLQSRTVGIGMPDEDVVGPDGVVRKKKKAPEATLDVIGPVVIKAGADQKEASLDVTGPVILRAGQLEFGDQRTGGPGHALFDNKGALIINNSTAWPAVEIGSPTVIHGDLTVKTTKTSTGEITEGGAKLKDKYVLTAGGSTITTGEKWKGGWFKGLKMELVQTIAFRVSDHVTFGLGTTGTKEKPKEGSLRVVVDTGGDKLASAMIIDQNANTKISGALTVNGVLTATKDMAVAGNLILGDVTITVEPVELFSTRIAVAASAALGPPTPMGPPTQIGKPKISHRTERKWFLTAPGGDWKTTNKKGVALVLRRKGQDPIVIAAAPD